jgi:hypothetical protein
MARRPRKYSLGVVLDTMWLWLTLIAVWGSVATIVVSVLLHL